MRSASAERCFLVSYNTLANNRGGKTHRLRASHRIDTRLTRVASGFLLSIRIRVSTASHGRGIVYTAQTKLPSILGDARR